MSLEDKEISSSADCQSADTLETEVKSMTDKIVDVQVSNQDEEQSLLSEDIEQKTSNEPEIDQKLYDEVLEKLDIVKKNQEIQEKTAVEEQLQGKLKQELQQNVEKTQEQARIQSIIAQDFGKIQKLMQFGLINSVQGQNLKQKVLRNAFDMLVQTEKTKRCSPVISENQPLNPQNNVFEEFNKSNSNFFDSDGRKAVLEYLKSDGLRIGKDELEKISNIVRVVEKTAIDRYLKKAVYEKNLRESNEATKQRLTANAQKTSFSGDLSRIFTREQIGKMSSAEFTKYESAIMEQLKKGLIK